MTASAKSIICVFAAVIVFMVCVILQQHKALRHARSNNAELRKLNAQLAERKTTGERPQNAASQVTVDAGELERLRDGHLELMRLRGEVGLLRKELAEVTEAADKEKAARSQQIELAAGLDFRVQYDPALWKPHSKAASGEPLRNFSWDFQGEGSVHISASIDRQGQTEAEFKKRHLLSQKFRGDPPSSFWNGARCSAAAIGT